MIQKSVCGFIVTPLDGDYHLPKMVLDGKCSKSPVTTGLPTHKTNLIFTPILIEIKLTHKHTLLYYKFIHFA